MSTINEIITTNCIYCTLYLFLNFLLRFEEIHVTDRPNGPGDTSNKN